MLTTGADNTVLVDIPGQVGKFLVCMGHLATYVRRRLDEAALSKQHIEREDHLVKHTVDLEKDLGMSCAQLHGVS